MFICLWFKDSRVRDNAGWETSSAALNGPLPGVTAQVDKATRMTQAEPWLGPTPALLKNRRQQDQPRNLNRKGKLKQSQVKSIHKCLTLDCGQEAVTKEWIDGQQPLAHVE